MTRKQAIKEFKREGMIIPESAVELAISDMEKIDKIEQIINEQAIMPEGAYPKLKKIKEVLENG